MGLFSFFKKKKISDSNSDSKDKSDVLSVWTGKDFEFLITGDINISADDYDEVMIPKSFPCTKVTKDGWIYYQVEQDEFTYSWEMPGIQMAFNNTITYEKAKNIVEEVVKNICATGQKATLVTIDKTKVYRFE